MDLDCVFPVASMAASFVGRTLVFAVATLPQLSPADAGPATVMEQALIERACPAPHTPAAYEAHERCLGTRLASLRADFGRDLSQLSTGARSKLDAACSPEQVSRGREAYIDCLSAKLASLSASRVRPTLPPPADAILPAPAATPSSAAPSTPAPQESSMLMVQLAAAGLAAVAGVAAVVFFVVKAKRARHVCRVCGVRVTGAGDLCAACRHDAAEAVRRAAAERAEGERAQEAEQRRQREHAEAQGQEQLRQEEERVRRVEEGRRLDEEARRREEDARQQEEDARQAEDLRRTGAAAGDAADSVFDPYFALGLSPSASGDEVRAAYEAARLKYAPDQVAHLGDDAQAHFAAKSQAVERAYQMLAGAVDESLNRVNG
jgi:hypothetical protein